MDILLVDPPYRSLKGSFGECAYSVGLTSLAAYLHQGGVETAVLMGDLLVARKWGLKRLILPGVGADERKYAAGQRVYEAAVSNRNHAIWKKITDIITQTKPMAVGIAYLTPSKFVVERIVELIKGIDSEIKIIAGSFHPTSRPEEVMQNNDIDFIIRGEGERPLLHLVQELKRDSPRPETVPGIYYRDKHGRVLKTPDAKQVKNLDNLPFPARELVLNCDYNAFRGHRISTSRGCPYSCSFCGDRNLWGSTVRRRSLDNVITELKFLKDNYKVKFVDIVDGTFTYDRKYLEAFCHAVIDQKLNLDWRCTARYDNLDEEILRLMKRANCTGMYLGFESGSERILQTIDKKTSVARNFNVAEMIYNIGIPTETSFMLGLPSETREDIEQTLQAMRKVKTGILDVNSYIPLPGTSLYNSMSEYDRQKIDWRKVSYKSFDNYFCKEVPYDEFQSYLSEAYDIAKSIRNRAIIHFGTRILLHSLVGLFKRK